MFRRAWAPTRARNARHPKFNSLGEILTLMQHSNRIRCRVQAVTAASSPAPPPANAVLAAILLVAVALPAAAQSGGLPLSELTLADLSAFKTPTANWSVAGAVESDRNEKHSLVTTGGAGVLANIPSEAANGNLFTGWSHGDLELEFDFMMPKESNSGVYLQGRYEIQLLDSWGVDRPTFADCGAIYQRWDEAAPRGERGFEGRPPRTNVSRAPGLWQHLAIRFEAPQFDASGNKTKNARFVRVEHNGVVVHENVEVTGPTRAAAFEDEAPAGPLMIQGDHGPVAFRNIRFKTFSGDRIQLSDIRYRFFEGRFERLPDFDEMQPSEEGGIDQITWEIGSNPDSFAVVFDGQVTVPVSGAHGFELGLDWITGDPHFSGKNIGGGEFTIGENTALIHDGRARFRTGMIELDAGTYPFRLAYYRYRQWAPPTILLAAEGPESPKHVLSQPVEVRPIAALEVAPANSPVLHRSFVDHGAEKRTHTISVGEPTGVHYSYDLARGALLQVWRGAFLDATPMWHSRGQDQLAVALGSSVSFSGESALAMLGDTNEPWPSGLEGYTFRGYELDADGRPTYKSNVGPLQIDDRVEPHNGREGIRRTLTVQRDSSDARRPEQIWCRVISADSIDKMQDGGYHVDGRSFYVDVHGPSANDALVRASNGRTELLVPVHLTGDVNIVSYSIIF